MRVSVCGPSTIPGSIDKWYMHKNLMLAKVDCCCVASKLLLPLCLCRGGWFCCLKKKLVRVKSRGMSVDTTGTF
jgi:hypothetical protein